MTSSPGQTPLNPNSGGFIQPPTFRQKEWGITQTIGGQSANAPIQDLLSGNTVVDIAVDEMINQGGIQNFFTSFSGSLPLVPWGHSGKGALKTGNVQVSLPKLMFVALSDVGRVDVIEVFTGRRVTSISVPGVTAVSSYWRQ